MDWNDFQDPLVSDPSLAKAVAADVNDYAQLEPIRPSMAGRTSASLQKSRCRCLRSWAQTAKRVAPTGTAALRGLDESIPTFVNFYVNAALRVLNELR